MGAQNDSLLIAGNDPLLREKGRVYQWNEFYSLQTGVFVSETLLPTGLQFKLDITGRDPSKWSVVGWYYTGSFWETTEEFRKAYNSPGFLKPGPNVDGNWTSTDQQGPVLPHDDLYPPTSVQPDGNRYAVDVQEKYVEWSKPGPLIQINCISKTTNQFSSGFQLLHILKQRSRPAAAQY